MKKLLLLCVSCLLSVTILLAQTREIKGIVADPKTGPLEGASVVLKGTSRGVKTNSKGEFTIVAKDSKDPVYLTVSFVGYKTQLVTVQDNQLIHIKLEISTENNQEEVVVIGYQSIKRKDIAGSVASIGAKDLKDVVVNSAEEAITGKLAGVQVTTSEGAPGSQVQIQIRGGGSITQSNAPLYIIDGIESDEGISLIAPQDIESIDVLKDAAATAIYGARGANGVVVVTTKGGKNLQGKTIVSYNGSIGLNKLRNELKVMDPYNFMLYQYERGKYANDSSGISPYGNSWDTVQAYKNVPNLDWQNKMFGRNAIQQTHNVSVSGGNAQTQYYLSLTDNSQDGIFLNSEYNRKLVTFKLDHKINDNVKMGFNVRYNHMVIDGTGTTDPSGDQSLSFLRQVIRYRPFLKPGEAVDGYDPNLDATTSANGLFLVNPVLLDNQMYRNNVTDNIVLNGYLNYQLTPHFAFRTTFGYDINSQQQNAFNDTITPWSQRFGAKMPSASINWDKKTILNNSNVFTYTNANPDNLLTLLLGEETVQSLDNTNFSQAYYMPKGITAQQALENMNLSLPPVKFYESSGQIPNNILSFFTSAKFNLKKKYVFTASLRTDGASVFSPDNHWATFPSGSASWLISKEKFMDKFNQYVSDLKIRASAGIVGNYHIPAFLFGSFYTGSNPASGYGLNNLLNPGLNVANLANPDLQWESTFSRDLGLDFGLLRNKLQVTIDGYINTTRKLLVNVPVPVSSGYPLQIQNVGSTQNTGLELLVAGTVIRAKDFSWNFSFNIATNDNVIKSLGNSQNYYTVNSGWAGASNLPDYIVKVGQKVGSMYGFVNDGFYKTSDFNWTPNGTNSSNGLALGTYTLKPGVASDSSLTSTLVQPGSIKYKDLNGDGKVDVNDRQILGSNQPKLFGGLTQTFRYKNWDASIFVNYRFGCKVFNDNKLEYTSGYTAGANMLAIVSNRWRVVSNSGDTYQSSNGKVITGVAPAVLDSMNKNASFWLPSVGSSSASFSPSSFAVEDGSFIRINNITIGYSLPITSKVMRRLTLTKLRFYLTVNNVAVITGYSGYDPEVNTMHSSPLTPGVDYSAYPRSRGYVCGVNLNF